MRRLYPAILLLLVACGGSGPALGPTNTPVVYTAVPALPSPTSAPAQTAVITVTQVVTVAPATAIAAPTATAAPLPPPTAPPTVTFTSVQGARQFGTARVAIKGPPNTGCTIAYTTPAGTVSQAQGLVAKTTDGNGVASWSWTIGTATRSGTGRVAVTCGGAKGSTDIAIG